MPASKEEWRDVEGYEGSYQISNEGNVRTLERDIKAPAGRTRKGVAKVMRPMSNNNDYLFVFLKKNGIRSKFYMHRLVACAFLPNPGSKEIVNHKDRDRRNNDISNLEWCTGSENQQHWRADEKEKATIIATVPEEEPFNPEDLPW